MLAIIPARKGSKRLPNKNMLPLCGKPLIYWTIQAAKNAQLVHYTVVSTDSSEIAKYAEEFCDVRKRPKELATDDALSYDVVVDVLDNCDAPFHRVILLQPTSPLRDSFDIDRAIRMSSFDLNANLVSVSSTCDRIYRRNGAIYIMNTRDIYNRNVDFDMAYVMYADDSIDIDTEEDFKQAERLMYARNKL